MFVDNDLLTYKKYTMKNITPISNNSHLIKREPIAAGKPEIKRPDSFGAQMAQPVGDASSSRDQDLHLSEECVSD